MKRFSIVIPAYNESATIQRCLSSLTEIITSGEAEVVVVCNGCHDDTADKARTVADVRVIELERASKASALNAGDAAVTAFPRIYLDADIEVSADALRATADVLDKVPCAAPRAEIELLGRPWAVRAFYKTWVRTPFMQSNVVGNGIYGLSESGRRRFGVFPEVSGDDLFIYSLFSETERRCLGNAIFTLRPPKNLRSLIKVRTRIYSGNEELAHMRKETGQSTSGSVKQIIKAVRTPSDVLNVTTYLAINSIAKFRASRKFRDSKSVAWERDNSTRV